MGLEIVAKEGPIKTPTSCEHSSCSECGSKLKTRQERIRVKDRNFICGTCYQHMVDPETCQHRIERVE